MMLETNLQKRCLAYARSLQKQGVPIIAINQHGSAFSARGVPDILMCVNGKFVAVELKVGDNKPTPLQEDYIDRINRARGWAYVIYDFEGFKEVIENALY